MPELPDLEVYLDALAPRVLGRAPLWAAARNAFVVRTVDPPFASLAGRPVSRLGRLGKRLLLHFDEGDPAVLAIHLMIAGRLRWRDAGKKPPPKSLVLAELAFDHGTLFLTEAGTTRRAAIHVVRPDGLASLDRGGLEPLGLPLDRFAACLTRENRTVKRALADPRLLAGIGNAYSDEILHRARLSPTAHTRRLESDAMARLHAAVQSVLTEWLARLRAEMGDGFPETVTAFRDDFAVHGKFGQPCPDCGAPVQRIRYASNETNYCARCQTGGRRLADRAMSRLLGEDWARVVDEGE